MVTRTRKTLATRKTPFIQMRYFPRNVIRQEKGKKNKETIYTMRPFHLESQS